MSDYIHYFSTRMTHQATQCSKEAVEALIRYHWPGNIRELINVIERAMLLCPRQEIGLADLPHEIRSSNGLSEPVDNDSEQKNSRMSRLPLNEFLAKSEREYLVRLLETTAGRIGETARLAKIDPRVLYQKMKRLKLDKKDFG
ncbi:MAG: helix-turn-helix domain-containing protein [Pirellulaceae bacterium]